MNLPGLERVQKIIQDAKATKEREKALLVSLVRVMHYVGGYEALLKLPVPAYQQVVEAIDILDEIEKKKMDAMMGGKKGR